MFIASKALRNATEQSLGMTTLMAWAISRQYEPRKPLFEYGTVFLQGIWSPRAFDLHEPRALTRQLSALNSNSCLIRSSTRAWTTDYAWSKFPLHRTNIG